MQKMVKRMWSDIHQSYFVVFLCVGILVGVVLGLVFRINYFGSVWWCVLAVMLLVVAYVKPKMIFVIVALLAGMVLAFFRVSAELVGEDFIRRLVDANVTVEGLVSGDPETNDGATKYKLVGLKFGEEKLESMGSVYVSGRKNDDLRRGDTVVLEGKMEAGFGTYAGYMWQPKVVRHLKPEPGSLILRIRDWFAERIRQLVPEPEVSLGLSYLLGMKTGLPDDLSENLRTVGLTHIVVASGAHLAILVGIAEKIFGKISRFSGVLFSGLFIIAFMILVGWTPSIMRAGMMAILTLMLRYVGRRTMPFRMILMVMAITLMVEPSFVMNMGWMLSFASYAGITMVGPRFTKFFYGNKKPKFIGTTVLTTLAATVMTLPIVLYYYGQVSLISVIANLLILPTLPYAMGMTFMVGAFVGIPGVGVVVAWCAKMLLSFHIVVVGWFGGMPEFLVKIPMGQVWVFVLYVPVAIMLLWGKRRERNKCAIIKA